MNTFIRELTERNYQKRKLAFIENGSWAPSAARKMKSYLEPMKNVELAEKVVTIKSTMKEEDRAEMSELVKQMM